MNMAIENDDNKTTEQNADILDSDDLLDESLTDALQDLSSAEASAVSDASEPEASESDTLESSSPELNTPEHVAVEETQHAVEVAAQASSEAEAVAAAEAQAAIDAKVAAEQAVAAAEEAAKSAEAARIAAQNSVEKEAQATEAAEAAIEAQAKAEEEAQAKAEEEAFLSNNLDEEEEPLETLSSLEKELGELTDWVEPEDAKPITANETAHLQSPDGSSDNDPEHHPEAPTIPAQAQQPTTITAKEETMTQQPKTGFGMANSIMLSVGLIATLIAALAIWMSLDASQQAANLASAPAKLQKQIKQLEQHQEKQTLLLQQQIENLQHQLKILTGVLANKTSEQWRKNIEQPTKRLKKDEPKVVPVKTTIKPVLQPVAPVKLTVVKPAPAKKPVAQKTPAPTVVKTVTKAPPLAPIVASAYAAEPGSVQGWVVYLFSTASQKSAEREVRKYRGKDIDAKYLRVISKGKVWYHTLVSGFETERAAVAFKTFLKEYHGIDAWHNKSIHKIAAKKVTPAIKSAAVKTTSSTVSKKQPAAQGSATPAAAKVTTNNHAFLFKAINSDVWLQISAANADATGKGQLLKEVLLKSGHHTTINAASESLWITTGNAPALSISVDGNVVAATGSLGGGKKILRNYRFDIK